MDVRAILVVAPPQGRSAERFAGVPLALLDIAGKNLVEHTAERLRRFGIEEITVVCDRQFEDCLSSQDSGAIGPFVTAGNPWGACERVFSDLAQAGAEVVFVLRLGAYVEANFDQFLQFHLDSRARVSLLYNGSGSLDIAAISASRRNDAAYLFRRHLADSRVPPAACLFNGFINRLRSVRDLRELVRDVLLQRTELRIVGRQIRPGIWAGTGVRVERGARLVAPAFLGPGARIRAAAVVTRASSIGHHAEIDCGTIVEASSVLPLSYVGAALELVNSVVGLKRLANLERGVEVEIEDPKLLNARPSSASLRAAKSVASLARLAPAEFIRSVFAHRRSLRGCPPTLEPAVRSAAELQQQLQERDPSQSPASGFENELLIARRYGGNQ